MSFYKEVPGRQTTLESTLKFDTTPTEGSTNPVTSEGAKSAIDGAVGDAAENLQEQIDEIAEKAGSGYIPKGEATVATLNGLSGQENGELYTMTDAGTLTDGSVAVVAGDTVAWDATNSVWYKAMNYAPAQYGTNEVHNLSTSITAFRTGDVIPVDGPSGTAKMSKDDLLKESAENALGSIHLLSDTATEDDLVSGNYFVLDGGAGTKKFPAELVAANEDLVHMQYCNVTSIWPNGSLPNVQNVGEYFIWVYSDRTLELRLRTGASSSESVTMSDFKKFSLYGILCTFDGTDFIPENFTPNLYAFKTDFTASPEGKLYFNSTDRAFFVKGTTLSNRSYIPLKASAGFVVEHNGVNWLYDGDFISPMYKELRFEGMFANYAGAVSAGVQAGEWFYSYNSHKLYFVLNTTGTGVIDVDYLRFDPNENISYVNKKNGLYLKWNGSYLAPDWDKVDAVPIVINDGTPATLQGNFSFNSSDILRYYCGASNAVSTTKKFVGIRYNGEIYYWTGTEAKKINVDVLPDLADFKIHHDFKDFSSIISGITFDGTLMSQVYSLFDALISAHSGFITKYDVMDIAEVATAMATAGFSDYPAYASGYKTYAYRINKQDNHWGNNKTNKKKKLFLFAGEHGWEYTGVVSAYLLAYCLLEKAAEDVNYFALFATYDIWVIPCLCGYGIINNVRYNGNGVNINRNYPDPNWEASGNPFDANYTGPSAASEFETNIIMAMADYIKPDLVIDVHNYDWDLAQQINYLVCKRPMGRAIYEAANDCCFALKKNYPEDFGTSYGLLTSAATIDYNTDSSQRSYTYFENYLSKPIPAAIIEVSSQINYSGGEHVTTNPGGKNSSKVFGIAEYEIMQALIRFTQLIQRLVYPNS